jgi:uncharacterized protein
MPARNDLFDLAPLRVRAGEGRRLELDIPIEPFALGAETYAVDPSPVAAIVDASRMTGGGWSLRLRFSATLNGPCMRCLEPAEPSFDVDAREVDQPGEGPELDSPYVDNDRLDMAAWARDALALVLPQQMLCGPECLGLCPECGIDLNNAESGHAHEKAPDRRWAALSDLRFDQ